MDRFLLAESDEQINMVSAWVDQLYCTILKNRTISLRAKKDMFSDGIYWFESRRGIRTPTQFIDAIESIDEISLTDWWYPEDALPVLYEHAPIFASLTHKYTELKYGEDEDALAFFCFCQSFILNAEIPLRGDFRSSVKMMEIIFNYMRKEYSTTGDLPKGRHHLMDHEIVFPARIPVLSRKS